MVRVIDRIKRNNYDLVLRGSEFASRLVLSRKGKNQHSQRASWRGRELRRPVCGPCASTNTYRRLKGGTAVSDSVAEVSGLRLKDLTDEHITI